MSDDDPFDDFDEDQAFDLLHDDGWTPSEISERRHTVDGEYLGPKEPCSHSILKRPDWAPQMSWGDWRIVVTCDRCGATREFGLGPVGIDGKPWTPAKATA